MDTHHEQYDFIADKSINCTVVKGQQDFTRINSVPAEHYFSALNSHASGLLDELQCRYYDSNQQLELLKKYTRVPFAQAQATHKLSRA